MATRLVNHLCTYASHVPYSTLQPTWVRKGFWCVCCCWWCCILAVASSLTSWWRKAPNSEMINQWSRTSTTLRRKENNLILFQNQVLCFRGTQAAMEGKKNINIRRDRSIIAHLILGLVTNDVMRVNPRTKLSLADSHFRITSISCNLIGSTYRRIDPFASTFCFPTWCYPGEKFLWNFIIFSAYVRLNSEKAKGRFPWTNHMTEALE